MKQDKVALKTLAMKARLANYIRKTLYKRKLDAIPDVDKIEIFDQIHSLNLLMHWELRDYKAKRKTKAKIQKLREARGYKPKKKTSKAEYEKTLQKA